ncbi:MAG: LysM peptidoglycan-binding domain-containing protein [Opitutales bacterium]|nr:LysM peptidoglycan-binding domain-containing protein [Opitutales bacterium]
MIRPFFYIFAFAALTVSTLAAPQGNSNDSRRLAVLINEVQALRDEVGQLKADLEALQAENARLSAENAKNRNAASQSDLAAFKSEIIAKLNAYAAEIDGKFSKQSKESNEILKNVVAQVNTALAAGSKNAAPKEVARPKDIPESGIEYTVKSGDTLTKIARSQQSKVDWIIYANPNLDPNRLQAGQKIVVPQK